LIFFKTGANPIKLWRWRNLAKTIFQSYKTAFFAENYVKSTNLCVESCRNLCQKIGVFSTKNVFFRLSPGANPMKLATPTLKKWGCCNYAKTIYQSYKTAFST
jgi:hypothetical protein